MIALKRAYDKPARGDGYRVLVDRLWPRGVRKPELALDAWDKELAPSNELRKWFGHEPIRWDEFARRYQKELARADLDERLRELAAKAARGRVTLLFAAHDIDHNNAVVLKDKLERLSRRAPSPG